MENALDRYDVLIIASMVEREALVPGDRAKIAAVIYNRLREGMTLGIDATLRYALNDFDKPLTSAQLALNTPYNTRIHSGLPPTPISNPGLASMIAASDPALRPGALARVRITHGAPHHLLGELVEVTASPRHRVRIPVTAR